MRVKPLLALVLLVALALVLIEIRVTGEEFSCWSCQNWLVKARDLINKIVVAGLIVVFILMAMLIILHISSGKGEPLGERCYHE
ncbi:MAG: hypothetical protein QW503_02360 [Sulfolobales archaeon]